MNATAPPLSPEQRRRGRLVLLAFVVICAAPVIASYLAYFVFKPSQRNNYGTLIEPQRDIPPALATTLEGKPFDFSSLSGRWIMVAESGGACATDCAKHLYEMRQLRLTMGKDRDRIERVWFINDQAEVPEVIKTAYPGTLMLRADAMRLAQFLPADDDPAGHLYIIDPHQHLMLRFPLDADWMKMKRDLSKLLAASEIG